VQAFVSKSVLLAINEQVILKVVEVQQSKKIKFGDAIIAATALVNSLDLITRNTTILKTLPASTLLIHIACKVNLQITQQISLVFN